MRIYKYCFYIIGLTVAVATGLAAPSGTISAVPSLDDLAGTWMPASTLRSLPALNNLLGSAQAANDLLALTNLGFPPLTLTGDTGRLEIDGQPVKLDTVRWYPNRILRRGTAENIQVESATRLIYEARGALFELTLSNPTAQARTLTVKLGLSALTSRHEVWRWKIPRDTSAGRFHGEPQSDGRTWVERDNQGQLQNAFSFSLRPESLETAGEGGVAIWKVQIMPGAAWKMAYTLSIGESGNEVPKLALDWADRAGEVARGSDEAWSARFAAMFQAGNPYFPGHLPTLETSDEKMRRLYYVSIVSLLSIYRTGFPQAPRVYVSNSPESNTIMVYFWDTREWATVFALLDPVMLKTYLRAWLAKGIYNGYAEEYLTGTLQGPWYSANDLSVFILAETYLNVTGDRAFLSEQIGGRTLLSHLDGIATHWQTLVRPGRTLADYGEADNLLECVPTYIHEVVSFNAANIWMMRQVGRWQEAAGNGARAQALGILSEHLLPAVLALYKPGDGVWMARHRDGSLVEIRHVFDFATVGLAIPHDLTPVMRREMTAFVQRELLVDHWMRAQSLSDPAASVSIRPDHGPMGAYCAWPGETMAAMCEFDEYPAALDLLRRCAAVTDEGPFSQSRQLSDRTPASRVRIAPGPQTYNASNGGSFAETIIREFFGFQPDLLHPEKIVANAGRNRGFEGRLRGLYVNGREFDLVSTAQGVSLAPNSSGQKP